MTPTATTDYRALRARGWRAVDAFRAVQPGPDPDNLDHATDLYDRNGRADWTAGPYTMTAEIEPDYGADYDDEYGAFTDDTGPDTIAAEPNRRSDYKRFRPEYSIAERVSDNRARGMTRADALTAALDGARVDMLRASEAQYQSLRVTASRAGVELGIASLSGLDCNPDPALPYGIGRSFIIGYLAESLADLTAEAIAQADERRPIIAAALAAGTGS